jgi:hypothetical protein
MKKSELKKLIKEEFEYEFSPMDNKIHLKHLIRDLEGFISMAKRENINFKPLIQTIYDNLISNYGMYIKK